MSSMDAANLAAKFVLYLATILAAGSPFLRVTVLPEEHKGGVFETWLCQQTKVGLILSILSVASLYSILQVKMAGGNVSLAFSVDFLRLGLQTAIGHSGLATLVGVGFVSLFMVLNQKWLCALAALILLGAFTFQGHSTSIPLEGEWTFGGRLLLSTVLVLHLLVVSWWLAVLLPLQAAQGEERDQVAVRFSEWALYAVPVLLLAGLILFLSMIEFKIDFSDPYQQRMALKIAAVVTVLACAALNKIWLVGKPGLLWSLRFETFAAFTTLFATSWLTTVGPAMS